MTIEENNEIDFAFWKTKLYLLENVCTMIMLLATHSIFCISILIKNIYIHVYNDDD